MAKQISSIQLKGRLLNISYYKAKHMRQGVARMTDPNASERAKTSPNYAAFRAYGKEFGMAGLNASTLIGQLPYRDQYMLNPNRTADLTRWMLPFLAYDTSHAVGKRSFQGDNIQTPLVQWLQKQVKNAPADIIGPNYLLEVEGNSPGLYSPFQFILYNTSDLAEKLKSKGIDGFMYNPYCILVGLPLFNTTTQEYDTPFVFPTVYSDGFWAYSSGVDLSISYNIPFTPNGIAYTKFMLIVLRPYRQIEDGSKVVLQEYSTALMARVRQEPMQSI